MRMEIEVTAPKGGINIAAGAYDATVASVEPADGEYGQQVKFVFALDSEIGEDGEPIALWAWASSKLNPRTKLYKWATALMDSAPAIGARFDVSRLTGLPCRVLVNLEDSDDGPRARVVDVQGRPGCSQCGGDVEIYTRDGQPFCSAHAPRAPQE